MAVRSRQIGWSPMANALYDVLREFNALKGQFAGPPAPTTTTTTTIPPPQEWYTITECYTIHNVITLNYPVGTFALDDRVTNLQIAGDWTVTDIFSTDPGGTQYDITSLGVTGCPTPYYYNVNGYSCGTACTLVGTFTAYSATPLTIGYYYNNPENRGYTFEIVEEVFTPVGGYNLTGEVGYDRCNDACLNFTFRFTGSIIDTSNLDIANSLGDPFAVRVYWGDGTSQIYYIPGESYYNLAHTYASFGTYDIVIKFLSSPDYPVITNKIFDTYCQNTAFNNGKFDIVSFNTLSINNCLFINSGLTSTVVDSILHQIVQYSPGPIQPGISFIGLDGQIPPAPLGVQGAIDKTTLISLGWLVTTD